MKKSTVITIILAFTLSLCGCKAETDQLLLNDVSITYEISETSTETSDNAELTSQDTEISDQHKDSYPLDFYSQTIPPKEKSLDSYTFTTNPKVFTCTISDHNLTDDEKIKAAAKLLAEKYIMDFSEISDKCLLHILECRNVTVDFLEHTIDRCPFDGNHLSISNGIGDMEVSENAWVIDFDAEIKFTGSFSFVGSEELDGENMWNHIPRQGMSECFLLYRQDDTFYLWARDVYRYERKNLN